MPRKGKKKQFRGVASWNKAENSVNIASSTSETDRDPVVNNSDPGDLSNSCSQQERFIRPNSPQSSSSESSNNTKTVSERKVEQSYDNIEQESEISTTYACGKEGRRTGYRLVDLACLNDVLRDAHKCKGGGFVLEEDFTKRNGLCSTLNLRCMKCGHKREVRTSKLCDGVGKTYDVNRRAAFAMGEIGLGREGMAEFCGIFDMPPPSACNSWAKHNRTIHQVSNEVLDKELEEAGQRLRKLCVEEDDTGEQGNNATIDATVSFDGTWHHRGFKSPHGVGIVMSVDTGQVLDAAVLSKECVECTRMRDKDPDSDEFMIWEYHHFEGGFCANNFDGPSTGMEQAAAKLVWNRSLEKHNIRYVKMLCDGDSKALNDLNNQHKPYGDSVTIEKLDCVNHVHKRMGKGLRNLRKSSKVVTGGSGGLTEPMINRLTDYYRAAIMSNTSTSSDPTVLAEKVSAMKTSIMAGLYHSVRQEDLNEQHKFCSVEWCKYLQDKRDGTSTYDPKRNTVPTSFLAEMKPLYERLSTPDLLKRCLAGLTQNQNEALNKTIWQKCPKEKYASSQGVERGVASAILQWNCGSQGRQNLMEALNLPIGHHTRAAFIRKDLKRLYYSVYENTEKQKLKRKFTKEESAKEEQRLKAVHGVGYGAGEFNT